MRSQRRWTLMVMFAALLFGGCSGKKKTPEQMITAALDQGVAALEAADVKAAGELLADDYQDSRGRDRQKLKAMTFLVLRAGPVSLMRSNETIEVAADKESAIVKTRVWATQSAADKKVVGDLIPRGQAVDVELTMVLRDGEYKLKAIEGDPLGGEMGL